ncbi:MAG: helix-turn-helix domain-containing protein [Planctomycetaceae bacterium]|nr:helix-turn-helix domain-containing protein [Planctomycetaceae bacterium]
MSNTGANIAGGLMVARDAAKFLCISQRKLWDLMNRGLVRAVRIDRAVRYDAADLRQFIEQRKAATDGQH